MKRMYLVPAILLLSALWLAAQTSNSTSQSPDKNSQTSIQGCLSGSAGSYTVTDQSGKNYKLQGDTSKLSEHVGHEVRITGTEESGANSAAGATPAEPNFNVSSVEKVSDSCSKK